MTDLFGGLPPDVMSRLRREDVPDWRSPMLATLTDDRFSDPAWIFERKFDGIRLVGFRGAGGVRLRSRNQQPLESTYPEVTDALAAQRCTRFVVDGEVVAMTGRRTSFERLQGRSGIHDAGAARATGIAVTYYVFDLLHLDGYDTTALPLTWRKRLLRRALSFDGPLRFTTHRVGSGVQAYTDACRRGDEGVIAKRSDSRYVPSRSADWLKFKCVRDQEFVVGGFTAPSGSRVGLGALLVGYYDGRDLVYAGKVGTGFTATELQRLHDSLAAITRTDPPFTRGRPAVRGATWVNPTVVAQIGFSEWTRDGRLRHPRYQGMRTDKSADEVVRETR